MDRETGRKVKELLNKVAEEEGIELEEVIMFGSRAREDYREKSDVDLLIVSPDFEDMVWNKRPAPFYRNWDYENLPTPEILCYTPKEYTEKKDSSLNIVGKAVEEGFNLA